MNAASHFASARRSDGSHSRPSAIGSDADEEADDRVAEEARAPTRVGVSTAAAIAFIVSIPVELVTPTEIGSFSTQSNGTTIVLERSRPSSRGPSSVNGTIASSTVTEAIVSSLALRVRHADPDLARA